MKVKYDKTFLDKSNSDITNGEINDYLIIGELYWVYGLRVFENVIYVYIYNGDHLFEVPLELFLIVDDRVSEEWKIKIWKNMEMTLWPDLFYEEMFIENFAERELKERQLFEEFRKRIEMQ